MANGIPAYAQHHQAAHLTMEEQKAWAAAEYALGRARETLNAAGSTAWIVMDIEAASEDLAVVARAIRIRVGMDKP